MTFKLSHSFLAALAVLVAQPNPAFAGPSDDVPSLLAGVRDHSRTAGDRLWPGYGTAPFGLLLVEADGERLFCQPQPDGFTAREPDAATGCDVSQRARSQMPDNLLSAMPVFGPPSTIVVGTPASTRLSPAAWSRVLLHEHFHQWQTALPDYYGRVRNLDLADGDESGMWMLNFPVPYGAPQATAAHAAASVALLAALNARNGTDFPAKLGRYLAARDAFASALGPRNWRYVEFQLWQEGVARWTEIELGRSYPDEDVRSSADQLERQTLAALAVPDLAAQGRLFAYAHGAGEAMLLEACNPGWRRRYADVLALGPLFAGCLTGAGGGRP